MDRLEGRNAMAKGAQGHAIAEGKGKARWIAGDGEGKKKNWDQMAE